MTSAGAPTASVPAGSPSSRAGPRLMRATSVGRSSTPSATSRRPSAERGLEPDDAVRRLVELDVLLVLVVRRVVGRDRLDRAVGEPGAQRRRRRRAVRSGGAILALVS